MRFAIRDMRVIVSGLVLASAGLAATGYAVAQSKPNVFDGGNRWLITAYDDTSPNHNQWATQGLCFLPYTNVGTHIQGVWYSYTFPSWRGRYSQEGDRVLLHGDYANDVGHDGIVIELFSGGPNDEGSGQWTEWRETGVNGSTIGFANARLRRVGKCRYIRDIEVEKLTQIELEKFSVENSSVVKPRLRLDGAEAVAPADREQAPLPEEGLTIRR